MIENASTLYKMIILYMLEHVNFPLSNSQITNFFLDREYTTYFHVQQTIHELLDSQLLMEIKQGNSILYETTENGKQTLSFFERNMSEEIRNEIDHFLKEHGYEMRNDNAVSAEYYRTLDQEYTVQCQVMEKSTVLIKLELNVPTEEIARDLCSQWEKKNQEIYAFIMSSLSK